MLPLMLAGAGLQYAGAQDKSTSIRLAMRKYLDNLHAQSARRMQSAQQLESATGAMNPTYQNNLTSLIQGVGAAGTSGVTAGTDKAVGQMKDAVAQSQAATGNLGQMEYQSGNAANADLNAAAGAHSNDRLSKLLAALGLARGVEAGGTATRGAMDAYSNKDSALRQKLADLFSVYGVGEAAEGVNNSENESRGASNMRFAQGVGTDSIQAGQLMQLGGLGYGAYGDQLKAWLGQKNPGATSYGGLGAQWAGGNPTGGKTADGGMYA